MSISSLYPNVSPSLLLDFARAKTLDPRITFTRTTTATYYDSDGVLQTALPGQARFDHNPVTGDSLGLLVEEQRTNLRIYSEEFNNSEWIKQRVSVTANTIVAPNGTVTGDKLIENTDNNTHLVTGLTSFTTASASVTLSVYAKKAERSIISLQGSQAAQWATAPRAYFNLDTGVVSQTDAGTTASITPVGNGWYRCVITGTTASSGVTNPGINIYLVSTGTTSSYTGDGTSGIYLWGAQVEAGAFATSYIPTTTTALTRNADVASMTGRNFSEWYNASEGTLYSESTVRQSGVGAITLSTSDGTANNRIQVQRTAGNNYQNLVVAGGTTQSSVSVTGVVADVSAKSADAYKVNDFQTAVNTTLGTAHTSGTIPVVSQLEIGSRASTVFLNGTIRRIAYYPERISDQQLRTLTT